MGSGRKRLIERSAGEGGEIRKKKKGKGSKFKERKESAASEPTHKSSMLESTATTEGRMMAQVCSTFNRMEQSRFEAFRRAAFPSDAISKYVAQCLLDEHGESNKRSPILSELVAPGQAEEICIVVSTLAKAYAQRLVTAARTLAGSSSNPTTTAAIEPKHILQAYQQRQGTGQDPGFFLQPAVSQKAVLIKEDSYQRKRLVALKVQEEYDKLHPPAKDQQNTDNGNETDNPMDLSSSSKS